MIKAVLIDDERPALRGLEHMLKGHQSIEIAGMFVNPLEAISKITDIKPQIVFLDINMPQLQGIDAASRILDLVPETDIVFVTAYDEYAVEAFELHALDYLLKPIAKERFEKTLQRVIKKSNSLLHKPEKKLVIKCFGRFQMSWQGQEPIKWRTEKTRELFAFLLHHQGREIPKEQLLDILWPDVEADKAVHQLHNGIYYIRKTLEQCGIERSLLGVLGSYSVRLGEVELDSSTFSAHIKMCSGYAPEHLQAAESLYTGPYLDEAGWAWADFEREKFSRQYCDIVKRLSQVYIDSKEYEQAERLLLKAFSSNPYEEEITELLMSLYSRVGAKNKAAKHLLEYTRILKEELGIKPCENVLKIYSSIK